MEVTQQNTSITFNPEGTPTKISVPLDVIFRIFKYLQLPDIVAFTSTCKNCHALTQDNTRWKPIILSLVPTLPSCLNPTSWFDLPALRYRAQVNLPQGKFTTTPHKQEGVSHMIPYGVRKQLV